MSSRPNKPRSKSGHKQRRSQSTARTGQHIQSGGIEHHAKALGDALRGGREDDLVKDSLTHPLHTYPARMHPATARALIALCFGGDDPPPGVVLDPFCGSGTTLVEGRAAGLDVVGSDLNPLAVRIARAKTWATSKTRLNQLRALGKEVSAAAFEEGKAARRADYKPQPLRVPEGIDMAVYRALATRNGRETTDR